MKIQEIRDYLESVGVNNQNCRDAARAFLRSQSHKYRVMLTLTLKQSWFDKDGLMKVKHYLSADDIPIIYSRFEHKLNRLVWKSKYSRYQEERLCLIKAWEDGYGTKRKHLHALVGNFPSHFKLNTLRSLILEASSQCYEIDNEYDATICDSEAVDYITKEVGKRDTDKILW
jgi:hypothetical protein